MIMANEENPEANSTVGRPKKKLMRLPEWKAAYDAMREQNLLVDGVTIPAQFFVDIIGPQGTEHYGRQIHRLIRQIEYDKGIHMRQFHGDYVIIRVERNCRHMANRDNKIARDIARNKMFGEATLREHGERLSDSEKRKIQRRIERNGSLLLFHCKPDAAVKAVKEVAEATLKQMEKKAAKFLELRDDTSTSAADIASDLSDES